jgi:hypothetical protein
MKSLLLQNNIEPPPAATVFTSSIGAVIVAPLIVVSKTCSNVLANLETSVLVPPYSSQPKPLHNNAAHHVEANNRSSFFGVVASGRSCNHSTSGTTEDRFEPRVLLPNCQTPIRLHELNSPWKFREASSKSVNISLNMGR